MKRYLSVILAAAFILSAAGCSASTAEGSYSSAINSAADMITGDSAAGGAATGGGAPATTVAAVPSDGMESSAAMYDEETDYSADIAFDATADVMKSPEFEGIAEEPYYDDTMMPPDEPAIQPQAGLLTGGEWNDNENWNDWVSLYQTHEDWNTYRDCWKVDFGIRHEVIVTAHGKPLEGAQVVQRCCGNNGLNSAVTDNQGRAYLFVDESDDDSTHTIEVSYGEVRVLAENVDMNSDGTYTVDMTDSLGQNEVYDIQALDLMLMIDTTGSMWDELAYIQAELEDVISRVKQENANIPVRVSVNFYRDEQDDYVIREFDFTDDVDKALSDLRAQEAEGGGDFPEAVHTALNSAVKSHDWKDNSTKLMFFVLDAPPHEDAQIIDEVNEKVELAAAQGIRIIPVASSGIDKTTEYLLRTMAFRTGGTYTFLTNHSGIGGGHIEPTIGDYEVEKLNDMMVRVIGEYLE